MSGNMKTRNAQNIYSIYILIRLSLPGDEREKGRKRERERCMLEQQQKSTPPAYRRYVVRGALHIVLDQIRYIVASVFTNSSVLLGESHSIASFFAQCSSLDAKGKRNKLN